MRRRFPQAAFTLVELIVAVAIVGVLVVLLLPLGGQMAQRSKEAKAVSNFRQIGKAIHLFAADNDGYLPIRRPSGAWPGHIFMYLDGDKRVLAEPNTKVTFLTEGKDPLDETQNYTSYMINSFDEITNKPKIFLIQEPAHTIIMAAQGLKPANFAMNILGNDYMDKPLLSQYRDGTYYLFADGSTRFVRKADVTKQLWLGDKTAMIP